MSDFLQYILVWYNVWFTAPIAFVFLFAIFQLAMGGLDFGSDADVDVDVDAEVDVDVDADVDIDADMDVDADAHSGSHGGSLISGILGILNVGKVPFTIILMSLFATWGISGLIVNEIVYINANPTRLGLNPQTTLGVTFVVAFLCSILGTRYLALGLSKLFPESERAVTDYHLLGLRGRVISGRVTTTFGTARVQVPDGPELTVSCRIPEGEEVPLKGDTVILVSYDKERRIFDVTKADRSLAP